MRIPLRKKRRDSSLLSRVESLWVPKPLVQVLGTAILLLWLLFSQRTKDPVALIYVLLADHSCRVRSGSIAWACNCWRKFLSRLACFRGLWLLDCKTANLGVVRVSDVIPAHHPHGVYAFLQMWRLLHLHLMFLVIFYINFILFPWNSLYSSIHDWLGNQSLSPNTSHPSFASCLFYLSSAKRSPILMPTRALCIARSSSLFWTCSVWINSSSLWSSNLVLRSLSSFVISLKVPVSLSNSL